MTSTKLFLTHCDSFPTYWMVSHVENLPSLIRVSCWTTMLASKWDIAANKQRIEFESVMAPTWHHQNAALWNWILTVWLVLKEVCGNFVQLLRGIKRLFFWVLKFISSFRRNRMLRIIIFFYQFKVVQISLPTILQHFNQCFVFFQFCDVSKVAIVSKKRKML